MDLLTFLIRHIVKTIHLYNWLIYRDTGIVIKNYRKFFSWEHLKKRAYCDNFIYLCLQEIEKSEWSVINR